MAGGNEPMEEEVAQDLMDVDEGPHDEEDAPALERVKLDYQPTYQRFVAKNKSFTQQYSHLYTHRLLQMRGVVQEAAAKRWGGGPDAPVLCERVINLVEGERVLVIGTLFKDMPLRPSVLDEYRDEATLAGPLQPVSSYVSDRDFLILEDESGRVTLSGDRIPVGRLCTGLVVAVVGRSEGHSLVVEDWCTAGIPPQVPAAPMDQGSSPEYVLLISGLKLSDGADMLPLQLLIDYIGGHLGSEADKRDVVSRVGRVIIAGDLLLPLDASALKEKHLSQKQQQELAQPLRNLDLLLSQLAAAVPVDVMPGSDDPSNFTLPQQPLHRCLLPRSSRYSSFRLVTNPYEASIGGRVFLGGSGQALADTAKNTAEAEADGDNPAAGPSRSLRLLQDSLDWAHIAPTAPDTLPCYPFCDSDPFVLRECPHVLFCGNQDRFESSLVEGPDGQKARVVCVPSFHRTQEAVLLELHSLDATPIKFAGYMATQTSN